ncbi:hypothetical protein [Xenorhabdus bovienii]|uniref:hypothetical protein n=1 Tax=Xenorhabdus bovienii TaxID=40576 RepID=UPI0023B2391E|nr:hypothetical protein [Xenorhabdus bovienii]MDE9570518.1 helix-turn-helix domain-containing protein [Xenorhabdus bovienii]
MADDYYTVRGLAEKLKISANTIYRNPLKYHMFRVGGSWRANEESLKKFEQQDLKDNNVFRLAVVGGKEKAQCRSTKEVTHTGSMYQRQMAKELDDLLARRTN